MTDDKTLAERMEDVRKLMEFMEALADQFVAEHGREPTEEEFDKLMTWHAEQAKKQRH
jgi:hypothetical protein